MARDFFFLIFYLIGINVVDLLLAKKEQVVNGRLEYIRGKTHKKYSIKIEPEAEQLLKKYEGSGDYLLNVMNHCKHYKSFSRQINEGLQSIGIIEMQSVPGEDLFTDDMTDEVFHPLIPGLTTYYARHSWATIAYEIGIPMEVISQAMGHSFGNKTTLIYIKFDPQKVDEANRKVIDYLLSV
jgi:integrase